MGTNELGTENFGTFELKTDNDFAVFTGVPANPLDVNGDGSIAGDGTGPAATDDVTEFVEGWLVKNCHNGIRFPQTWKPSPVAISTQTGSPTWATSRS